MTSSAAAGSRPVVTKTAEGHGRAEEDLPVDILYSKLIDFLVSRQQLSADWRKRLQVIQSKAAQAWGSLPAHVASSLQPADHSGSDAASPDYFVACQARDALAVGAGKTVLGYLKGEAGTWDAIVRAYQSKGVWLGEAATALARNVDYEIPYHRAQAGKLDQQLMDAERRCAEYLRLADSSAAEYRQELAQLGISGKDVRRELRALGAQLPGLFKPAVERLRGEEVSGAVVHYAAFAQHAHPPSAPAEPDVTAAFLPTLQRVRTGTLPESAGTESGPQESGQSSLTAVQRGAEPGNDVEVSSSALAPDAGGPPEISWDVGPSMEADAEKAETEPAGIDWGIDMSSVSATEPAEAATGISWEVEVEPPSTADAADGAAGISWDIDMDAVGMSTTEDAAAASATDAPADIDWGVEVADEGAAGAGGGEGISIDWDIGDNGGAAGTELSLPEDADDSQSMRASGMTATIIADSDFRNRLLDDLHELRAFLLQRAAEQDSATPASLAAAMPEDLQLWETSGASSAALAGIDEALAVFTGPRATQLLMIQGSERYSARLVAALQQQAGKESKYKGAAHDAEVKRQQMQVTRVQAAQRLAALQKRTAAVKLEVEGALCKALGRQVNIQGEINNVL